MEEVIEYLTDQEKDFEVDECTTEACPIEQRHFTHWIEALDGPLPDGFAIEHARATDTLNFGPFANTAEVRAFLKAHPDVRGTVVPLYKTVDWSRRPGLVGVRS